MKKKMTVGSAVVAFLACLITPTVYEKFQKAEVNLTAPVECRVGELVVFDASESKMDSITWNISPLTTNFKIIDDGKQAIFSAEEIGNYIITVAVVNGKKVDLKITELSVYSVRPNAPLPDAIKKMIDMDGVKDLIDDKLPDQVKQVINFDQVKNLLDNLIPKESPDLQCDPNDPDCCPEPEPSIDIRSWLPSKPQPRLDRMIKGLRTLNGLMDKNRFESEDELIQATLWGVKRITDGDDTWQPFNINIRKYLEDSTSQKDCNQRIKNLLAGLKNAQT